MKNILIIIGVISGIGLLFWAVRSGKFLNTASTALNAPLTLSLVQPKGVVLHPAADGPLIIQ